MLLHQRIAALAASMTVLAMFGALAGLQPTLTALAGQGTLLASLASLLASAAIYSLLLRLLLWLFGHWRLLRKLILGRTFLEGTWVGHYEVGGVHRFTIEIISQRSGAIQICGREFEGRKTRASWISHTVSVDEATMRLMYAYSCEVFDQSHVHEGLGVFNIVREGGWWPRKLDGYATDLTDGKRDPNTEVKIGDGEVPDEEAFAKAEALFLP